MGILYKIGRPFRTFANKYEAKHRKPLPYKGLAIAGGTLLFTIILLVIIF